MSERAENNVQYFLHKIIITVILINISDKVSQAYSYSP